MVEPRNRASTSARGLVVPIRRESLLRELARVQEQLVQLAREVQEQGLREPVEMSEFFAERDRLESRVQALRAALDASGVDVLTADQQAAVGRRVVIQLPEGEVETWELARPEDASPREGRISVVSPLGRALLGKASGELAEVQAAGESYVVRILEVAA